MLARIVNRHRLIEKKGKDCQNDDFWLNRTSRRKILEICDHAEDMRQDSYAMKKFEKIYMKMVEFYDKKYLLDKETVFQLHCRNFINRHGISDAAYLQEIAKGPYCNCKLFSSQCKPLKN